CRAPSCAPTPGPAAGPGPRCRCNRDPGLDQRARRRRGRADAGRVPGHRDLCVQTRSVAEIAALLSIPLGVSKVLVGDMAGLGLVFVHAADTAGDGVPNLGLMERVLSGLRRL
ncbi:LOW QUALITY PROTEIN: hypothetical protein KUTG_01525, partial [Kutzneria sp. 744]